MAHSGQGGSIPDDAGIFLLCEKWGCPPSVVLKEGSFWIERALFHLQTQAEGKADAQANLEANRAAKAQINHALGG